MLASFRKLKPLAVAQHGYFTAKQAKMAGFSKCMHSYHCQSGNWLKYGSALFRLPEFADSPEAEFVRWTLWSRNHRDQPQGVISHASALAWRGLGDYTAGQVHLTVPFSFRKPAPPECVVHKASLSLSAIESGDGFMITRLARTLEDMRPDLSRRRLWDQILRQVLADSRLSLEEAVRLEFLPAPGVVGLPPPGFPPAESFEPPELAAAAIEPASRNERIFQMICQRTTPFSRRLGRAQGGFTLVELLVVMAIISVLAAMLLPALDRTLAAARSAACRNNLKQVGYAILNYAGDFNDCVIPYNNQFGNGWCRLAQPYLNNKLKNDDFNGVTLCPSTLRTSTAEGTVAFPVAMSYSGALAFYDGYTAPGSEYGGYFISWANLSKARSLRSISPGSVIFVEQNLELNLIAKWSYPANVPYCYTVPAYTNDVAGSYFNLWGASYRHDKQGNFMFVDLSVKSFPLGQQFTANYWRPVN